MNELQGSIRELSGLTVLRPNHTSDRFTKVYFGRDETRKEWHEQITVDTEGLKTVKSTLHWGGFRMFSGQRLVVLSGDSDV